MSPAFSVNSPGVVQGERKVISQLNMVDLWKRIQYLEHENNQMSTLTRKSIMDMSHANNHYAIIKEEKTLLEYKME